MMTALGNRIRLASERSSTPCVRLTRSLQRAMRKRAENAESSFSLHAYLYHLHRLAGLRAELDRAGTGVMDSWSIEGELAALRRTLHGDISADLQREHQEVIDQYEAHLRSTRSLEERRDSIDLRMKSAVSALQQIAVDVSRLRGTGVPLPLPSLRDRARELSSYVDDVRAGYRQASEVADG